MKRKPNSPAGGGAYNTGNRSLAALVGHARAVVTNSWRRFGVVCRMMRSSAPRYGASYILLCALRGAIAGALLAIGYILGQHSVPPPPEDPEGARARELLRDCRERVGPEGVCGLMSYGFEAVDAAAAEPKRGPSI